MGHLARATIPAARRGAASGRAFSVVGVDGCSGGWVAVELRGGAFEAALAAPHVSEILTHCGSAKVIGVDIPIGLERGRFRRVDAAAKRLLGRRGSTLFETPPAEVLAQEDYRAALARAGS